MSSTLDDERSFEISIRGAKPARNFSGVVGREEKGEKVQNGEDKMGNNTTHS